MAIRNIVVLPYDAKWKQAFEDRESATSIRGIVESKKGKPLIIQEKST